MTWTPQLEAELRFLIVAEYRSKKRRRYQAQCEGKSKFQTSQQAYSTMRHANMQAFRCRFCGAWHVAHSRPKLLSKRDTSRNG